MVADAPTLVGRPWAEVKLGSISGPSTFSLTAKLLPPMTGMGDEGFLALLGFNLTLPNGPMVGLSIGV